MKPIKNKFTGNRIRQLIRLTISNKKGKTSTVLFVEHSYVKIFGFILGVLFEYISL